MPGTFVSFDSSKRKATVQPSLKLKYLSGDKKIVIKEISPINNVPVVFTGTKDFVVKFPIKKGDGCLLLFSESPIGNYLNSSSDQVETDDLGRFELGSCIAIPGLFSFANIPNPASEISIDDAGKIMIKSQSGKLTIEKSGMITFNDGTEAVILGTQFITGLKVFLNVVQSITPGTLPQDTAALTQIATAAGVLYGLCDNYKSQKIKVM